MSETPIDEAALSNLRRALVKMPALEAVPPEARGPLVDETLGHVSTYLGGFDRGKLQARLGDFDRLNPSGSSGSGTPPPVTTKFVTCETCGTVFPVTCP